MYRAIVFAVYCAIPMMATVCALLYFLPLPASATPIEFEPPIATIETAPQSLQTATVPISVEPTPTFRWDELDEIRDKVPIPQRTDRTQNYRHFDPADCIDMEF